MSQIKLLRTMKEKLLLIFLTLFLLCCATPVFAQTIYFSETWDSLSGWAAREDADDSSVSCQYPGGGSNPAVTLESDDLAPGCTDYAIRDAPGVVGNFGCGVANSQTFSLGEGSEFYVSFWIKYGASNLFDSGAGKNPDILGTGAVRCVMACPASFDETWSIPTPEHLSAPYASYYGKLIPSLYIETQGASGVGWPFNVIHCTSSGSSISMSQNINVGTPYYIERGYWYRITVFIKAKLGGTQVGDGGRYRVWLKKGTEAEVEIIDTDLATNCNRYLNTLGVSGNVYNRFRISPMWNDHGGGGTNLAWTYLVDDIYVTDYKMADGEDTTPPVPVFLAPSERGGFGGGFINR